MPDQQNQPRKDDAVLGGQSPPPSQSVVLGGIDGVKRRLSSPVIEARVAALKDALNYGDAGLDLVIQALQEESRQVQRSAYRLLRKREEPQVKQVLKQYKPWNLFERFCTLRRNRFLMEYASQFANRKVENFDPQIGICDPVGTAYALRVNRSSDEKIADKLKELLSTPQASKVEALVFGDWGCGSSSVVVDALLEDHEQLINLKALFIGDIEDREHMISSITQSDLSYLLEAYPNLEVLQVRGDARTSWDGDTWICSLAFSPLGHDSLTTLIVEAGGLNRWAIAQICALELPALEHLELWLGSPDYGGNSSVDDLMPILSGGLFPHLTYLGLRNSEYSDAIAKALVRSRMIEQIRVLDLSMGTLGEEGAEVLLNCPAVNQLDILNVAENYLSRNMVERLSQLDCQVIAQDQRAEFRTNQAKYRYCSVAE